MNYITQIKAFYDQLEDKPLSASAIALWYTLMYANNKAGWAQEFSKAASILSFQSGLSERSLVNARNELKMKGYISFYSRKGNQSAVYQIIDLYANIADNASDKLSDNASALIKPKPKPKLKQDINNVNYAEFVSMTEDEYNKLVNEYGEGMTKKCIEVLDNYKGSSGKKYKSDYRTMLNWVVNRVAEDSKPPKLELAERRSGNAKPRPSTPRGNNEFDRLLL